MKTSTLLAATLGASFIFCSAAKAGAQTYTIHFNPKPGVVHYSMKMKTATSGGQASGTQTPAMNMDMDMGLSMTIKNLPNHQHKVTVGYTKMHMTMNGKSMDQQVGQSMKGATMTMVMDSNGKQIKSTGTGALSGMGSMGAMTDLGFFGKPVTVGKSFVAKGQSLGMGMEVTYKLLGVNTVGGRRLATFEIEKMGGASGPASMLKIVGHPHTVVDADTGMIVSMMMKMNVNTGQGTASTQISMKEVH